MASTSPTKKAVTCTVLPRVTFLGEALAPVAKNLRQAMSSTAEASGHEFVTLDDLIHHMDVISQAARHLSPRFQDLMDNVINSESAGMAEASRAAGRLEQVLSEFVDGYHEAQASHAGPEATEARELLLGVYRHHVREICDWLDELVWGIANPRAAIKKKRIPFTPDAKLSVILNLTSPPEMAKLDELVKRLQVQIPRVREVEPAHQDVYVQPQQSSGVGILGTIGALVFGFGINRAIWRRHR